MENFDRDFESNNSKLSEERQSFENDDYEEQLAGLEKQKHEIKKEQEQERKTKMKQLLKNNTNEKVDGREKVQEFIRKNCSEPIDWVDTIIWFKDLAQILIKSAEEQVAKNQSWYNLFGRIKSKWVLKSLKEWNAKDKRIYELPVYKQLIKKWFILPSDVRTYYDSADREPVYHLWVDYNVKWGTEVKSMYKWKVVKSWLDGWLWHKVIIEHETGNWTKFYSLYGHLGSKNLPSVWQTVEKWMKIWEVWKAFTKDNWDWNSHLHFQIMEDIDSKRWYSKIEWEWNYDVLKSFGKK